MSRVGILAGTGALVPLAQATSERLALTVAALIAVAVLAVLGGLVVLLFRRQAQAEGYPGPEPDAGDDALWAAGTNGASAGGSVNGTAAARDGDDATEEHHAVAGERTGPDDTAEHAASPAMAGGDAADDTADHAASPVMADGSAADGTAEQAAPPAEEPVVRPPAPEEGWTAEIIWAAHATRFRVVARRSDDPEAEPVAIAQTEPLPWPPRDDASVQALTDASATLESVLLDSGWTGLPTGQAWYSKRFAWAAQDVAPEAPRPTGRFDRRRAQAPEPVPPAPVARDAGPLSQ